MSNLPLVNVTAQVNDQQGRPCAGAVVKMRLCSPDKYQGLIVPREVVASTDAAGRCVLRVFPNALGYEGSLYDVHISFPGSSVGGACGQSGPSPIRTIRAKVYVPNEHCNLMDIIDLAPRDSLPAGSLLPAEVAGYAAQAADSAAAAKSHATAASSILAQAQTSAGQAEAAKDAAQAADSNAQAQAKRAKQLVDGVDDAICNFENIVTGQVEQTANRLTADAIRCMREQEAVSLAAIEQRGGEALDELTRTASESRSEALAAIKSAEGNAVHAVEDARDEALEDLREVGGQFEEDFLALTERAEGGAKKAACSAASAANSATKACSCAEQAQKAAQDLQRHRDDALDAARRAETAQVCAESAGQRAAAAADMAQQNADYAAGSAKAAQEAAKAADAGADLAKQSADMAVAAQQAVAQDKAYVEGVADDVERAVHDVAVDMLTPQVVTQAVDRATAEAEAHAQAAARSAGQSAASATEAARQANLATKRADRAQAAQSKAEDAAQRAETAADSATEKAEALIARMVEGMFASWTLVQGVNEGGLLPLPEGCGYYPGHHAVRLSWDGLACHQNRQWEEAGEKGVLSHAVRLLFAAPADSDFEVNIAAHADLPEVGTGATILKERLARLESNISGLSSRAVSYTELP